MWGSKGHFDAGQQSALVGIEFGVSIFMFNKERMGEGKEILQSSCRSHHHH
jgi:hypothetical protein